MKARKVLTAAAILALVLGAGMPAMAEDNDGNGKINGPNSDGVYETKDTTTVNANVTQAYTVTIPETIDFGTLTPASTGDALKKPLTVSANNVIIPNNTQLNISVGPTEGTNFAIRSSEGATVNFDIDNGTDSVAEGGVFTSFAAGNISGGSVTGNVQLENAPQYSGTYTGTITFTCSVEDTTSAGA